MEKSYQQRVLGSEQKVRVFKENLRKIQELGKRKCFEEVDLLCEETEALLCELKKDSSVPESQKQRLSASFSSLVEELEKPQNLESLKKSLISSSFFSLDEKVLKDSSGDHLRIHQKIRDINEMFKDCSETVKAQGASLDRIDSVIESSNDLNSKARFEIEDFSSSHSQKKTRCLKFVLTSSFLLIFVIILLFLFKFY